MVVWQSTFGDRTHVDVYSEDDVQLRQPGSTWNGSSLFRGFGTTAGATYQARWPREYSQPVTGPLFDRAARRRSESTGGVRQTQHLELPPPGLEYSSVRLDQPVRPVRRIRLYARTGEPFSFRTERSQDTTPAEQVGILTGGIKLNVDSPQADGSVDPQAIELAADNMVLWTESAELTSLGTGGERLQTRDTPLQIYLEGNIVIRQGDQILKANRAFYDAQEERALLLDAELKLFVPSTESYLRVRASRIRQLTAGAFHAQQAWMSASYFGKPGYRLEANDIFLEPRVVNPWVHAQGGWVDPTTGEFDDGQVDWLTSLDNRLMIGDTPVFYSPYLAGPAENPNLPIRSATFKQDRIFGTQVRTAWDPFHLFAKEAPEELTSSLLLDYFSERGPGAGLEGVWDGKDMFGAGDRYLGEGLAYYVHDDGADNLGLDRRAIVPPENDRGRLLFRHKHDLPYQVTAIGELGYARDRNFLEQWYEAEFDQGKDQDTRLILEQNMENLSWSVMGQPQLNHFENNTEWFPKGDLYVLGEPVFGSPVTWTMHSSAGYGQLNPAAPPTAANDLFTPLPWVSNVDGGVFMSRQELSLPFMVGPVVLSPFVWGEAAHWDESLTGDNLDRFVGSAGLRGSLSMWRALPYVRSSIFNLNGLAHRMVFDFEYSYTDSSQDITSIAQYNSFDDDAQERFRQRLPFNTFGGAVPGFLNARNYAIRTGSGSLVSVPWHELVDDLHVLRFGWHHRLQTKVGPPEAQRIRDWMTLDLDGAFFPRAGHHNPTGSDFGEDFGLLSARYQWLLSDRTALLASGLYDTFDGGQQIWNLGMLSQRSARGSVYAGVRQIRAQSLDSRIATGSVSYLMSDKWVGTASTAYDLGENMNRGQSLTLTRIGADFLFHFGFSIDRSKDNIGVAIALEPRFGQRTPYSTQMNSLLGLDQF